MPRAMRSNLALKLATVALGAATLAIAAGQLPAQADYGPPPPPPNAPGGFHAVITSQTIGPAGGVIGPVRINGLTVALTIRPGTFTTPVQITLTAPNPLEIGAGGHPGYRAVGGVGVQIEVNGKPYTGNFGRSLTLDISGFAISPGVRVGVWDGTEFKFIAATVGGPTVRVSFVGSGDFAVFVPTGGGRGGQQAGSVRSGRATAVVHSTRVRQQVVLTSLYLAPAGLSPAGIGVLAPEWLAASSH